MIYCRYYSKFTQLIQCVYNDIVGKKKKLLEKDKELKKYVSKGGSHTAKEEFFSLLGKAAKSSSNRSNSRKK